MATTSVSSKFERRGVKPEFIRGLRDKHCYPGEQVTLEVRVFGAPAPDVSWTRDGRAIGPPEYEIRTDKDFSRLIVRDISDKQTGCYTCQASNTSGEVTTSCNLNVSASAGTSSRPRDLRTHSGSLSKLKAKFSGGDTTPDTKSRPMASDSAGTSRLRSKFTSKTETTMSESAREPVDSTGNSIETSSTASTDSEPQKIATKRFSSATTVTLRSNQPLVNPAFTRGLKDEPRSNTSKFGLSEVRKLSSSRTEEKDKSRISSGRSVTDRMAKLQSKADAPDDLKSTVRTEKTIQVSTNRKPVEARLTNGGSTKTTTTTTTKTRTETTTDGTKTVKSTTEVAKDGVKSRSEEVRTPSRREREKTPETSAASAREEQRAEDNTVEERERPSIKRISKREETTATHDVNENVTKKQETPSRHRTEDDSTTTTPRRKGRIQALYPMDEEDDLFSTPPSRPQRSANYEEFQTPHGNGTSTDETPDEEFKTPRGNETARHEELEEEEKVEEDEVAEEKELENDEPPPITTQPPEPKSNGSDAALDAGTKVETSVTKTETSVTQAEPKVSNPADYGVKEEKEKQGKTAAPSFIIRPRRQFLQSGGKAKFKACGDGIPPPSVAWVFHGKTIEASDKYKLSEERGYHVLEVLSACDEDKGMYTCQLSNVAGQCAAEAELDLMGGAKKSTFSSGPSLVKPQEVKKADVAPTFTSQMSDVAASDGDTVSFSCEVTGDPQPTVTWNINGKRVRSSVGKGELRGNVATLTIREALPELSGKVECVVTNSAGEVKQSAVLDVADTSANAPEFVSQLEDQSVQDGESVVFRCRINARPEPRIRWYHQGKTLRESDNFKMAFNGEVASLQMNDVFPEDSGEVKVTASNEAGRAESSCNLAVKAKPPVEPVGDAVEIVKKLRDVTVEEGSKVSLSVEVKGTDPIRIVWMRKGRKIPPNSAEFNISSSGSVYTLELPSAAKKHAGEYSCDIVNDFGDTQCTCTVTVNEKPKPKVKPAPAVVEKKPLAKEPEKKKTLVKEPGKKTAKEPPKKAAPAKGEAKEAGEEDEEEFAAEIITRPKSQTAEEGQVVKLTVQADGNPVPEVLWLKDNNVIEPAGRFKFYQADDITYVFEINPVQSQDSGRYVCIVSNDVGADKGYVQITVVASRSTPEKTDFRKVLKKSGRGSVSLEDGGEREAEQVDFRGGLKKKVQTKQRPAFEARPQDAHVSEGGEALVECNVTGTPRPHVQWFFGDKPLSNGGNYLMSYDGKVARLIIREALAEHEGQYFVKASNEAGEVTETCDLLVDTEDTYAGGSAEQLSDVVVRAHVTSSGEQKDFRNSLKARGGIKAQDETVDEMDGKVQGNRMSTADQTDFRTALKRKVTTKQRPDFIEKPRDVTVPEGDPAALQCRVVGFPEPEVTWWKDGEQMKTSRYFRIDRNGDYCTLRFMEADPEDAGYYEVKARNDSGEASELCELTVSTYDFGSDEDNVPQTHKKKELHLERNTQAAGEQVDFRAQLRRHVKTKERPHVSSGLQHVKTREGLQVLLSCDVRGTPQPNITWLKNGKPITDEYDLSYDGRTAKLTIDCLSKEDVGEFTCRATNEAGEVAEICDVAISGGELPTAPKPKRNSVSAAAPSDDSAVRGHRMVETEQVDFRSQLKRRVKTKRRPEVTRNLLDQEAEEGDSITFRCTVTGEPAPEISWLYDQTELRESRYFKTSYDQDSGVAELTITEIYVEDEGEYMIVCKNEAGEALDNCELSVSPRTGAPRDEAEADPDAEQAPPFIEDPPHDTTALIGAGVILRARFSGEPRPQITWIKGKDEVAEDRRVQTKVIRDTALLILQHCLPEDSAKYYVVINNTLGEDEAAVSLRVEDKPDPPQGKPEAALVTCEAITLVWSGPAFDGGSKVTAYRVEMNQEGDYRWRVMTSNCKNTSYQAKGLKEGQRYRFRVSAENVHGVSESGPPSDFLTAEDRPQAQEAEEVDGSEKDDSELAPKKDVQIVTGRALGDFYDVKEVVGKGRFGNVHLCVDKLTGQEYAVKIMKVKGAERDSVRAEVELMNSLHHQRLVMLHDAFEEAKEMAIVMDYVKGGELFERIVSDDFIFTERDAIHFMRGVMQGVKYLHSEGIVHLDIKPENILCVSKDTKLVKLVDFGLSRKLETGKALKVMFGTPEFVAPEIPNFELVTTATDIWSVGVMTYLMLSGVSPFLGDDDNATLANVTAAKWDYDQQGFQDISFKGKDFVKALLVKDPKKRLSAEATANHPWLTQDPLKLRIKTLKKDNLKKYINRRRWQLEEYLEQQEVERTTPRPPEFVHPMKSKSAHLKDNYELCLNVIGNPQPKVTWSKLGRPIRETRRITLDSDETGLNTLSIQGLGEKDAGEYLATAENEHGKVEHTIELKLLATKTSTGRRRF